MIRAGGQVYADATDNPKDVSQRVVLRRPHGRGCRRCVRWRAMATRRGGGWPRAGRDPARGPSTRTATQDRLAVAGVGRGAARDPAPDRPAPRLDRWVQRPPGGDGVAGPRCTGRPHHGVDRDREGALRRVRPYCGDRRLHGRHRHRHDRVGRRPAADPDREHPRPRHPHHLPRRGDPGRLSGGCRGPARHHAPTEERLAVGPRGRLGRRRHRSRRLRSCSSRPA